MITCECPGCHTSLDITGFNEMTIIECPKCRMRLEIVSVEPPIAEESLDEIDREWEE
jgi:lysine biosynthesis protein LysW